MCQSMIYEWKVSLAKERRGGVGLESAGLGSRFVWYRIRNHFKKCESC